MKLQLSLFLLLLTVGTSASFAPVQFRPSSASSLPICPVLSKNIPAKDWERCGKISLSAINNDSIDRPSDEKIKNGVDFELSLPRIEKDVIASANAKVDTNRVKTALSPDNDDSNTRRYEDISPMQPSQLSVALASGFTTAVLSFLLFYQPILSAGLFLIVTYIATRDPLHDHDGLVPGDTISGPVTRIVGRATISTIEKSKPKVKAVARAAVFGDEEINVLRKRIENLKAENEKLRTWIERRNAIDENSKFYKVGELREMAKQEGIAPGGKKAELMMRLIEAGVLKL